MGLRTSHDAFHGTYPSFHRFRVAVAEATSGEYASVGLCGAEWRPGKGYDETSHPGLAVFFTHSDCDGNISPEECRNLAIELAALLFDIDKIEARAGRVARQFITGCLKAADARENLEFH